VIAAIAFVAFLAGTAVGGALMSLVAAGARAELAKELAEAQERNRRLARDYDSGDGA
jgi:Ethanolamine utilization protein EutJ (predicted chaperonin)